MNSFYKQPLLLLWIESIILILIGFWPTLIIVEAAHSNPLYYFLFLIYLPVFQFCSTPLFRLTKMYTYYSPMLLGYNANKTQIDLHSGTSFDYLFVMRKFKIGIESRNAIVVFHLEGLLNIIQMIESDQIPPTVNIVGTSYFFNERTVAKLGFKSETPSLFYRINLLMNVVDLVWMYSVSKGHLAIPNLFRAKKLAILGKDLAERKDFIFQLHAKMVLKKA